MFSFARTTAKEPRDFYVAMHVVQTCLEIVWTARANPNSELKFWALENPMGYLRQFLGKPPFVFQPYEFGDMHYKHTDIWGYFNEPRRTHTVRPKKFNMKNWGNPKAPSKYRDLNLNRAAIRAITPAGFARAFYEANK